MGAGIEQFGELVGRIAAPLSAEQQQRLARYLALVDEYSATLNLTGFGGDPARLADELIGEALRLNALGGIADGARCVDLGSGNGSPVVVLAALNPRAQFSAVEARKRRAAFLRTVQVKLGLANLTVLERRVELLAEEQPAGFELVTSRAFAPLKRLLPLALKLLSSGGELRGYLGADAGPLQAQAQAGGFSVDACLEYGVDGSPRHVYRLKCGE